MKPGGWKSSGCWKLTSHWSGDKVGRSVRSSVADKSLVRSCAALHTHEQAAYQKERSLAAWKHKHTALCSAFTLLLWFMLSYLSFFCLKQSLFYFPFPLKNRGGVCILKEVLTHTWACHQPEQRKTNKQLTETGAFSHHQACVEERPLSGCRTMYLPDQTTINHLEESWHRKTLELPW